MATRSRSPHVSSPPVTALCRSGGVTRARGLARLLDDLIRIPGTNIGIGLDPIIGLIPGVGDVVGGLMSSYILMVAAQEGVPTSVMMRMLGNIALDSLVGVVPVLGDLFDFAFKAQTRNLALLEGWLATPAATARRSRRGLLLLPLLILLVFATLTVLGVWMLYLFFTWLRSVLG